MGFLRRVLSSLSVLQPTISRPQTPIPDVPPEMLEPATIVQLGVLSNGLLKVRVLRLESRWDGDTFKSIGEMTLPDAGIDLRRSIGIASDDGTPIGAFTLSTEPLNESNVTHFDDDGCYTSHSKERMDEHLNAMYESDNEQ